MFKCETAEYFFKETLGLSPAVFVATQQLIFFDRKSKYLQLRLWQQAGVLAKLLALFFSFLFLRSGILFTTYLFSSTTLCLFYFVI